jgi:hypothetical protein
LQKLQQATTIYGWDRLVAGLLMHVFSALFFLTISIFATSAKSADFARVNTDTEFTMIVLRGAIERGDYGKFLAASKGVTVGGVLLRSVGGAAIDGIKIGREIRRRGYATGVAPNYVCLSACALIWVGGSRRYMAPSALIGFHAAYIRKPSGKQESGWGNALVGAYLRDMGLSDEAIFFATEKGPDEIAYLTIQSARRFGIAVNVLDENGALETPDGEEPHRGGIPLQLPSGFRWIVLASASDPGLLPAERMLKIFDRRTLEVVKTRSGKFALVAGPYTQQIAEQGMAKLKEVGLIKADVFLSSGNGFVSRAAN